MRKKFPLIFGVLLASGFTSLSYLKKRNDAQVKQILESFVGTWYYVEKNHRIQHTLAFTSAFTLLLDEKPLQVTLIERTTQHLVWLDSYGYRLILRKSAQNKYSFYDEAEDASYKLVTRHVT